MDSIFMGHRPPLQLYFCSLNVYLFSLDVNILIPFITELRLDPNFLANFRFFYRYMSRLNIPLQLNWCSKIIYIQEGIKTLKVMTGLVV